MSWVAEEIALAIEREIAETWNLFRSDPVRFAVVVLTFTLGAITSTFAEML